MNWYWFILGKVASAARDVARYFAWILEDLRRWQWVDFVVMVILAVGLGLVSAWLGAMVFFIAVVMLVRHQGPALPITRMPSEQHGIDETWDEFLDSPCRRHATMTHEYSYRAFEDD